MTNLTNTLKTMEKETTGVKNDVINYLLENSDNNEDLQTLLEDINNYGCQSGQVNHLIYYTDTVRYFEEHKEEITSFLSEVYDLDILEGSEFINALSDIFPVDDFETRMNDHEVYENAMEIVEENNGITTDELDEFIEDYEEEVFEERYELATELNIQDKNYLSWAIFENEAVNLENELNEMGLIK